MHLSLAKVWDLKQGKEVACARGHEGWTVSIQFSPDEKSIVCIDKNSVRVIHSLHSTRQPQQLLLS